MPDANMSIGKHARETADEDDDADRAVVSIVVGQETLKSARAKLFTSC